MAEEQGKASKILGGSLFLKIIIIVGVLLIVSVFIFGMNFKLGDMIWNSLKILIGILLIVLVIKGIQGWLKPKPFSPTESFRKKVIRIAKKCKPFNAKNLYIRGEDMRVYSKWGKITGLLFIPYMTSSPVLNEKGELIYIPKKDKNGKDVKDDKGHIIKVPKRKLLTEKDGEWCFVTSTSPIPLLGKEELIRAHHSLVSEIGESTWIKTPNLVPVGEWLYPCQQWQDDIIRVEAQHKDEALIETYEEFLDLLAHVTKMSLGSDPTFQKIIQAQTEAISSANRGVFMRE